ncbi:hypothetical protein DYQ93_11655 [Xanthomonas sp. LMG 8992]|uniref:hypothetical protein n=1 Tax=Xanthomonas sp. LMG 8992 TaxID=1591157 RepID=UPI00136E077B|nr:hypothetical protein [Xanthomonas sp. LMG 8992]MXV11676.1 hypothetical protein [Xanthomonas sp. LMG 8992]
MDDLAPNLLHILRHALGTGEDGRAPCYRNHFVTGEGSSDHPLCMQLATMGLMVRRNGSPLTGGADLFTVTQEGRAAARPEPGSERKLTRAQRRYREFLNADSGVTFGEWIRQRNPIGQVH